MRKLTDAVDFKRLQQLQDNVSGITGLTAQILEVDGTPITRASRPNAFCTLAQSANHEGDCFLPDAAALARGKAITHTCRYSGCTNIYVPFVQGGECLGVWATYQVRPAEALSESLLAASAMYLDISAGLLSGAVEMLPALNGQGLALYMDMVAALATDVLESRPGFERIEQSLSLINKFMNTADTGLIVSDADTGLIQCVNRRCEEFLSSTIAELSGKPVSSLPGQDFDAFYAACTPAKMLDDNGVPREPMMWNDYSPRHGAWLRCTNQLAHWPGGRLLHIMTFRDITDEQRTKDELSRLAYYDRQMKLPNSQKLSVDLEPIWSSVAAAENFLICFDTTALRKLNDAHGRRAGDVFLHTVIKWIERQSFENIIVYRIEGDEFCIRLTGADSAYAQSVAKRIYERFGELWSLTINGQPISIICGVSLSVIGLDSLSDDDELLNVIQRTLDISRKEGKIVIYDEETDRELKTHIQVQLSLKKSVKQRMKGFAVHYQPIVDPASGLWKGLEALCRWNSPEAGPVSPAVFIREAEQLGLIGPIGEFVLEESVRQCKEWGLDRIDGFFVSVNLSPVQIMSTSLISNTLDILRRHDFPGNKLSLEVTESTKLNFNNHTLHVIENLCNHGIKIALDDFGTGYSSFNNMKNLPVSFVKTDHTFIQGIEQDHYMQYFYNVITELAHKTGMKLVVEGVETQEQLEIMLKNGVDYIQGYFFGRPMPPQELENHLGKFVHAVPPKLKMGLKTDGRGVHGREGYLITTGTFNVQTQCMRLLLDAPDIDAAISEVLAVVGQHFGVSRAYLFQRDEGTLYTNTHEWCATGVVPQKPGLERVDIHENSPSWLPSLAGGGLIVASDISHLPEDIATPMAAQQIKAMAIVPLEGQEGEGISGFMGFDDCATHRNWQSEEIVMLKNLAMMMESGLRKARSVALPAHDLVAAALSSLPLEAFAMDENGVVLWCSPLLQARVGDVTGQRCFHVMPDYDGRCEGCRAKALHALPGQTLRREVQYGGQTLLVYNTLVQWAGGKPAVLEYSVDITEYKNTPIDPLAHLRIALESSDPLDVKLGE